MGKFLIYRSTVACVVGRK